MQFTETEVAATVAGTTVTPVSMTARSPMATVEAATPMQLAMVRTAAGSVTATATTVAAMGVANASATGRKIVAMQSSRFRP